MCSCDPSLAPTIRVGRQIQIECCRGRNNRAERGGLEPLELVEDTEKGPLEVACLPCHLAPLLTSERFLDFQQFYWQNN